MLIGSIKSKGIRRLVEADSPAGLPAQIVPKVRIMLAFLQDMATEDELRRLPVWKPHQLSGDREGIWALHVTKSWRLTFRIDEETILDLDYEDYH